MNDKEKGTGQEKGSVRDRLRMMQEIEKRNDKRVEEWSGEHEQDGDGS